MSDMQLYRKCGCDDGWTVDSQMGQLVSMECDVCDGAGFVPDTRLQEITDAWEHGTSREIEDLKDWPELYDLLSALSEEDSK